MYSITVPDNPEALRRAAEFFAGLCGCLVEPRPKPYNDALVTAYKSGKPIAWPEPAEKVEDGIDEALPPLGKPTTWPEPLTDNPSLGEQTKDVDDPGTIFSATATVFQGPVPVVNIVADDQERRSMLTLANGIPWDERIHSGSRKTLQSPPHGWKLKKQPAEFVTKEDWLNYVAKVEAELKGAMVFAPVETGGHAPPVMVETLIDPTNPVSISEDQTLEDQTDVIMPPTPPPLPSTGVPLTYAGLTEKICQAGIQPPQVQQALRDCGLENYPELMKAPELIPQIAQLLGVA